MIVLLSKGERVSRQALIAVLGPMAEQAINEIVTRRGRIVGYLTRPEEFRAEGYAEQIVFVEPENEPGIDGAGKCSAVDIGSDKIKFSDEPLHFSPSNDVELLRHLLAAQMGTHEEIARKIAHGKGNIVD